MKKYKTIIVITYFLLAICGFAADYFYGNLPKVVLRKAQMGMTVDTVTYSGTIQASTYHIFSSSPAMIKDVYVKTGQYVEEGQLLARLDINNKSTVSVSGSPITIPLDQNTLMNMINTSLLGDYSISVTQTGAGIHAPHAGYIQEIHVQNQEYITLGHPLFTIMDYSDMRLCVRVGEDRINDIKVGQSVSISGSGFSGKYAGYVEKIDDKASQSLLNNSGSQVAVTIAISDADDAILPGFTASAAIRLGVRKNVIKIPIDVIDQDQAGQEYVWIYNNGTVQKEYVNCTYSSSGFAELTNFDMDSYIVAARDGELSEGCRVLLDRDWKTW